MSTLLRLLTLSLLVAAVYCNHDHHNHHKDDKWITFVSQIEAFWKTNTSVAPSETYTEILLGNKGYYTSDQTSESNDHGSTPETPTLKGTSIQDVKEGIKMSLAAIISIPIVGVIVLICCCYCICKCCCGLCASDDKVVVMNSHVVSPPPSVQPTQIIVQQPIIQQVPHAYQESHQLPPHQQWGQQQFQQQIPPQFQQHGPPPQFQQQVPPPQYYSRDGIENPNFYHPSAPPPQMGSERY